MRTGLSRAMAASLVVAAVVGAVVPARGEDAPAQGKEILQDLKKFREMGSVLYVAAHPDDENTQLITYLARGRGYRTAYLSLTRGDGGQNVLGPEFGEQLGLIRTQELLAARRIDGGRQFFTRALDFGFSKDYRETLRVWDKEQVLGDVVRVIRQFRPDVMVTRFSPEPGGTHGHHTASAVLAVEAFKLAGDPKAYPEQLSEGLTPWTPKRILQNGRGGGGGVRIDVGGTDPVTGESFGRMAARSRAMHKSQGFGNYGGGGGGGGPRVESFTLLGGEPAEKDIMDGVDMTWGRVEGGKGIGEAAGRVIEAFDAASPEKSVGGLLQLRAALAKVAPGDVVVDEKREELDRVLEKCLGLEVRTTVARAEVVAGEGMRLRHTAAVRSGAVPVRWVGVRYPAGGEQVKDVVALRPGETATRDVERVLPVGVGVSQPYWLKEPPTAGMFKVADEKLIGRPENPPAFPVEDVFEVGGQELVVKGEPVQAEGGRRLEVIAPVWLHPTAGVKLFQSGATETVSVSVGAARAPVKGVVRLGAPEGWKVEPAEAKFELASSDGRQDVSFRVTAPGRPVTGQIAVKAVVNGATYGSDRVEIKYAHIPPLLLQPPAGVKGVALELATRGRRVGYLPGAGDSVAEALGEMKYEVRRLSGEDLSSEGLKGLDAVVVGVRAFNVREDLTPERMAALWAYVEQGGNVIVQYNRPEPKVKVGPVDVHVSLLRVTEEDAKVTVLRPEHPAVNVPNKIVSADFDGWVQERGSYYPDRWDESKLEAILESGDEGETPLKGGLLIGKFGKGYYVYTGLTWFRQLPAGVPGAYRLFANLVSLGKE